MTSDQAPESDAVRQAFERYAIEADLPIDSDSFGGYRCHETDAAWDAWQAALAQQSPPATSRQLAQRIVDRGPDTRTEAEIVADGVAFVLGPGGDEGTRFKPAEPPPTDAEPVAWLHDCPPGNDCDAEDGAVISARSKAIWMEAKPEHVEHYTVPLYRHPPAVAVPREPTEAMQKAGLAAMFDSDFEGMKRKELYLIIRKGWRAMWDEHAAKTKEKS
jgi:hypothetical protein